MKTAYDTQSAVIVINGIDNYSVDLYSYGYDIYDNDINPYVIKNVSVKDKTVKFTDLKTAFNFCETLKFSNIQVADYTNNKYAEWILTDSDNYEYVYSDFDCNLEV